MMYFNFQNFEYLYYFHLKLFNYYYMVNSPIFLSFLNTLYFINTPFLIYHYLPKVLDVKVSQINDDFPMKFLLNLSLFILCNDFLII
jgi:hypothetical protein